MRLAIGSGLAISMLVLGGCNVLGGTVKKNTLDEAGITVLSYNADTRGAFFAHKDNIKFCAEPAPDIALNRSVKAAGEISGNIKGVDAAAKANAELASQVVELAGRNSTVVLARELLYRTCEQAAAGHLEPEDVLANYNKVVDLIRVLAEADKISAEAKAGVPFELVNSLLERRNAAFNELLGAVQTANDDASVKSAMKKAADSLLGPGNNLTTACDTRTNCSNYLQANKSSIDRSVIELLSRFKKELK